LIAVVAAIAFTSIVYVFLPHELTGRVLEMWRIFTVGLHSGAGRTALLRVEAAQLSISLIQDHWLLGVGLANWPTYADAVKGLVELDYPHNFLMETASESGVITALVLVATIVYLFVRGNLFVKIWLVYFFICTSSSGDIPYLRFLITLPLAYVCLIGTEGRQARG
jgi:hypothetical protein